MTALRQLAPIIVLAAAGGCGAARADVPPPPRLEAQPAAPAPAAARPAAAAPAAAPASAASAAASGKPGAKSASPHVRVIEDDNVRIEETRVRGQLQRITVQNKVGPGKGYEIIVPPVGAREAAPDGRAAGQSAWSLFSF